jgi:putative inorganic carbon (hco3(-)) transporter
MAFALWLVYLACSFIRPFELMPELARYNPMVVLGLLALLAGLLSRALMRDPLVRRPQLLLVGLFVLWAMFSVVMSQRWFGGAIATLGSLSANLFVFYLLVLNVDTLRRFRITIVLLTTLMVVISVEGILAYHTGYREEELIVPEGLAVSSDEPVSSGSEDSPDTIPRVRSRGFLNDPNDLAQALVAVLPFIFALRRPSGRRGTQVMTVLPVAVILYAIVLTRSRGGILALLVLIFLALRDRLRVIASTLMTVAGGGLLLAVGIFGGRATSAVDESGESRIEAWRAGWEMLKGSPLWGVGYGFFTDHHERVAHNSFVHCFAELGLIGYFLWLGILLITLREVLGVSRGAASDSRDVDIARLAKAAWLSLISFLVAAFFLSRGDGSMLFLLVGLSSALTELARRRRLDIPPFRLAPWMIEVGGVEFASIALIYLVCRVAP